MRFGTLACTRAAARDDNLPPSKPGEHRNGLVEAAPRWEDVEADCKFGEGHGFEIPCLFRERWSPHRGSMSILSKDVKAITAAARTSDVPRVRGILCHPRSTPGRAVGRSACRLPQRNQGAQARRVGVN